MDVEGAEVDVLRGALNLLNLSHPDMLIELHNMEKQTGQHPAIVIVENPLHQAPVVGEIALTAHIFARWRGKISRPDAGQPSEKLGGGKLDSNV